MTTEEILKLVEAGAGSASELLTQIAYFGQTETEHRALSTIIGANPDAKIIRQPWGLTFSETELFVGNLLSRAPIRKKIFSFRLDTEYQWFDTEGVVWKYAYARSYPESPESRYCDWLSHVENAAKKFNTTPETLLKIVYECDPSKEGFGYEDWDDMYAKFLKDMKGV